MIGPPKLYFVRNTSARRPDAFFTAFVQYLVFRYQDFQACQFEKSLVGPKNANLIHSESRAELAFCQGLGKMTTCMKCGNNTGMTVIDEHGS